MKMNHSAFALLGTALATAPSFYAYKQEAKKAAKAEITKPLDDVLFDAFTSLGYRFGTDIFFKKSDENLTIKLSLEAFTKFMPQPEFDQTKLLFEEGSSHGELTVTIDRADFTEILTAVIKSKDSSWAGKKLHTHFSNSLWDATVRGLWMATKGAKAMRDSAEAGGHSARRAA